MTPLEKIKAHRQEILEIAKNTVQVTSGSSDPLRAGKLVLTVILISSLNLSLAELHLRLAAF